MKKLYFLIFFMFLILLPNIVLASNIQNAEEERSSNLIDKTTILEEQETSFGIRDFLKEAKNYAPDFINDLDVTNIFNKAISGNIDNKEIAQKVIKLLGTQVENTLKILINILVIVLIHSILKSITDGLENNSVSRNGLLCSIYFNSYNYDVKFCRCITNHK